MKERRGNGGNETKHEARESGGKGLVVDYSSHFQFSGFNFVNCCN
jgi:hypothetical protein